MSTVLKVALTAFLSFFSYSVAANILAYASLPTPAAKSADYCNEARRMRENIMRRETSIVVEAPIHTQEISSCFTPDENLVFTATIEAQRVLGPHAQWFKDISEDVKARVVEACSIMGYENSNTSRAYDYCLENQHEKLISPYIEKYQKESSKYLRKRQQIADSLVVRCDASLSIKRSRLPKEMRFPVGWYNVNRQSVPSWMLEEKIDDNDWLENMSKLKVDNIMTDILGNDCPGEMIYWVTYDSP